MTELRVSEAVCQRFPRLRIAAVVARGFGGHEPWPEVDAGLAALEKAAANGDTLPDGESDPHIAAWYAAYRAFGTNPKRERPSVGALRRRLARTARLPRINAGGAGRRPLQVFLLIGHHGLLSSGRRSPP